MNKGLEKFRTLLLTDGEFQQKLNAAAKACTGEETEEEMKKGYLFSTKDGAFSFADEVPGMTHNAKNAEGFIEITPLKLNHRVHIEAYCCEACRLVQFRY